MHTPSERRKSHMKNKIREAAARRKNGEGGFTLVELLVVVVIIVALAAISIPVFLNQKTNADKAAQTATVKSIATFVNEGIANGSLTSVSPVTNAPLTSSVNGSIAVPSGYTAKWTGSTFCVNGPTLKFANTDGDVVTGNCA